MLAQRGSGVMDFLPAYRYVARGNFYRHAAELFRARPFFREELMSRGGFSSWHVLRIGLWRQPEAGERHELPNYES